MYAQIGLLEISLHGRIGCMLLFVVMWRREQSARSAGGTTVSVAWWCTCGLGTGSSSSSSSRRSCKSSRRSNGGCEYVQSVCIEKGVQINVYIERDVQELCKYILCMCMGSVSELGGRHSRVHIKGYISVTNIGDCEP